MRVFSWLFVIFFCCTAYAKKDCSVFLEKLSPYEVIIADVDHDTYGKHHITWSQTYEDESFDFSAQLDPKGVMTFSAYLVNHDTKKRSDLRGAKLFKKAIRFFKRKNIRAISAHWNQGSDNYNQFFEALEKGHSPEEAAFMTWTGRNAYANGFKNLTLVEEKVIYDKTGLIAVVAVFEKEGFKFPFFK